MTERSRFEIDNGVDFERLDSDRRLASLRVFAENFPLLMANVATLTERLHSKSVELVQQLKAADGEEAAKAACEDYSVAINNVSAEFTHVFILNARRIGEALAICGVQLVTNPPSTGTKQ